MMCLYIPVKEYIVNHHRANLAQIDFRRSPCGLGVSGGQEQYIGSLSTSHFYTVISWISI
eukprot:2734319-Heterocapsa_arctica.AAC.1